MPQTDQQLAARGKGALDTVRALLEGVRDRLEQVATKHLTPERLIRSVIAAVSRTPQLLEATPQSLLQCVMVAAQLGLEPNTPLGHFYLVPFANRKTGKLEATPIIGYRGLVELARRSGKIASVEAHVVHANDPHEVRFGMDAKLWHSPCLTGEPGSPLFVYAIATMEGGAKQAEVMTWSEVMAIKGRSRASGNGPWVTDVEEMAKKTVFRRLSKWLPLTVEAASALEAEDNPEISASLPPGIALELPPAEARPTRSDAMKSHLRKVIVQKDGETEEQALERLQRENEPPPPTEEDAPPPEPGSDFEPGASRRDR